MVVLFLYFGSMLFLIYANLNNNNKTKRGNLYSNE